jgi:predicted DNA-binding transcriptional regulator AlpA
MSEASGVALMAREPEDPAPPPQLLRSAAVKSRMGDISSQTLWRYCRDPGLEFPRPIYICGIRYWEAGEIDAFIKRQKGLDSCRRKSTSDPGDAL